MSQRKKASKGGNQRPAASWKDLKTRSSRGTATRTSRRRRRQWMVRTLFVFSLSGIILAGVLGIAYFGQVASPPLAEERAEAAEELEVDLETDGVLTAGWLRTTFPGLVYEDPRNYDVKAARDRLESHGQVLDARVSLELPRQLRVELSEREPVLRVRVRSGDVAGELWLLSRDGHFYQGADYPPDTLRRLPGLVGLRLRADGAGYRPVAFFEEVARVLDLARERVPSMFRHWRLVDLRDWHPLSPHRSSLIRIRSGHVREIVFSPENPERQVERLRIILNHTQRQQMGLPRFIDLSFDEEGVVRYE